MRNLDKKMDTNSVLDIKDFEDRDLHIYTHLIHAYTFKNVNKYKRRYSYAYERRDYSSRENRMLYDAVTDTDYSGDRYLSFKRK